MESSLISKKKSIIPSRRNPSLARDPDADDRQDDAVEAMKRLRQIETRSASLQVNVRGAARPSAKPEEEEVDPMEEMRLQREATKERTATTTSPSPPSPMYELRQERLNQKRSVVVPPQTSKNNNQKEDESVNDHTGSALPVKEFGRHESKVPPNTVAKPTGSNHDEVEGHTGAALPIKAFSRHASRVPPNTVPRPSANNDDDVLGRTGSSLPIKSFGRKESKVPPNSIVRPNSNDDVQGHTGASLPVKAFGRHESKVPPNTIATEVATTASTDNTESIDFHTGSSLPVKAFGRHESKAPPGTVPKASRRSDRQSIVMGEQAAHRKRFSLVPRVFHRQEKTDGAAPPKPGLVKRFQSLQPSNLPSFRRKPSRAVGKD